MIHDLNQHLENPQDFPNQNQKDLDEGIYQLLVPVLLEMISFSFFL